MWEAGDFWVGDRLVRPSLGEIRLGLERVRLEPRSMSVLLALAGRPREVIPKAELIREVWGDAFVSDEVLTHAIWDLRRAFGDSASRPEFIQTVPKRGYRLIAPVRRADEEVAEADNGEAETSDVESREGQRQGIGGWLLRHSLLVVALFLLILAISRIDPQVVTAYFEIQRSVHHDDPDIEPFYSIWRHDIRAIRDFLHAIQVVYRNEVGGSRAMRSAIRSDPDFVAPWVWQASSLVQETDPAVARANRAELDRLHDLGSGFEKAMIRWLQAVLDGEPAEQVRYLEVALEIAPRNRILRLNLAGANIRLNDLDEAWSILDELLEEGWCFPGLFSIAGAVAQYRDRVDDVSRALEAALDCPSMQPDPETLDMLRALALYNGDTPRADDLEKRLDRRVREMLPEVYESDTAFAEWLAEKAQEID